MNALVAASIQLDANEVNVRVHKADYDKLPDDTWFLTLSVLGGYCTLTGTLEELRQLGARIGTLTAEVGSA